MNVEDNSRRETPWLGFKAAVERPQVTETRSAVFVIDNKLTFEKLIRDMASSIDEKSDLISKCYKTLGN